MRRPKAVIVVAARQAVKAIRRLTDSHPREKFSRMRAEAYPRFRWQKRRFGWRLLAECAGFLKTVATAQGKIQITGAIAETSAAMTSPTSRVLALPPMSGVRISEWASTLKMACSTA
jgi:hypothetical protein